MNKIKKLVQVAILMVLSITVFTICNDDAMGKKNINSSSSQVGNNLSNNIRQPQSKSANSSSILSSSFNIKNKSIYDNVIVANIYGFRPANNTNNNCKIISFFHNGIQRVKRNDWGSDYKWLNQDFIYSLQNRTQNIIKSKDYYDDTSTFYKTLSNDTLLTIYGDINLQYEKIKYINFLEERKEPNETWIEYFRQVLMNETGNENTPVIIKEVWNFTLDGKQANIVTATNCINSQDIEQYSEYESNKLSSYNIINEKPIIYKMTSLFIENSLMVDIISPQISQINNFECNDSTKLIYYSYQYDEAKNVIEYPVITTHSGEYNLRHYSNNPSFLILDIDLDCINEIICFNDSSHSLERNLEVYDYESGEFERYLMYAHF